MATSEKFEALKMELLKDLYRQHTEKAPMGKPEYVTFNRIEKQTDYHTLDTDTKNQYKTTEAAYEELQDQGYATIEKQPRQFFIRLTEKGKKFIEEDL